ncbi:MAG: hypothetical protein R3301_19695 [Saprospiraceae bacterium]|nr:hypothetical protein [Saprospiraceae bacterium]
MRYMRISILMTFALVWTVAQGQSYFWSDMIESDSVTIPVDLRNDVAEYSRMDTGSAGLIHIDKILAEHGELHVTYHVNEPASLTNCNCIVQEECEFSVSMVLILKGDTLQLRSHQVYGPYGRLDQPRGGSLVVEGLLSAYGNVSGDLKVKLTGNCKRKTSLRNSNWEININRERDYSVDLAPPVLASVAGIVGLNLLANSEMLEANRLERLYRNQLTEESAQPYFDNANARLKNGRTLRVASAVVAGVSIWRIAHVQRKAACRNRMRDLRKKLDGYHYDAGGKLISRLVPSFDGGTGSLGLAFQLQF